MPPFNEPTSVPAEPPKVNAAPPTPVTTPGVPAAWQNNVAGYQLYLSQSNQMQQIRAIQLGGPTTPGGPSSTGGHGLTPAQTYAAHLKRFGYRGLSGSVDVAESQMRMQPVNPVQPQVQKFSGGAVVVPNKTERGLDLIGAGQNFFTSIGLGAIVQSGRDTRKAIDISTRVSAPTAGGQPYVGGGLGMFAPQPIRENVARQIATMAPGMATIVGAVPKATGTQTGPAYAGQAPWNPNYQPPAPFNPMAELVKGAQWGIGAVGSVGGIGEKYDTLQKDVSKKIGTVIPDKLEVQTPYNFKKGVFGQFLPNTTVDVPIQAGPLNLNVELYPVIGRKQSELAGNFFAGEVEGIKEKPLDTAVLTAVTFALPGVGMIARGGIEGSPTLTRWSTQQIVPKAGGWIERITGRTTPFAGPGKLLLGQVETKGPFLSGGTGVMELGAGKSVNLPVLFGKESGQVSRKLNLPIFLGETIIGAEWGRSVLERVTGKPGTITTTEQFVKSPGYTKTWKDEKGVTWSQDVGPEIETKTVTTPTRTGIYTGKGIFFGFPVQMPGDKGIALSDFPTGNEMMRESGKITSTELMPAVVGLGAGDYFWPRAFGYLETRGMTSLNIPPEVREIKAQKRLADIDKSYGRDIEKNYQLMKEVSFNVPDYGRQPFSMQQAGVISYPTEKGGTVTFLLNKKAEKAVIPKLLSMPENKAFPRGEDFTFRESVAANVAYLATRISKRAEPDVIFSRVAGIDYEALHGRRLANWAMDIGEAGPVKGLAIYTEGNKIGGAIRFTNVREGSIAATTAEFKAVKQEQVAQRGKSLQEVQKEAYGTTKTIPAPKDTEFFAGVDVTKTNKETRDALTVAGAKELIGKKPISTEWHVDLLGAAETRKGIGKELLTSTESFAKTRGGKNIDLDNVPTAKGFYEKMDYTVTDSPWGADELGHGVKSLSKVPPLNVPRTEDVPVGIRNIFEGQETVIGKHKETKTELNLKVIPEYVSDKAKGVSSKVKDKIISLKDVVSEKTSGLFPEKEMVVPGGLGYAGPGYPVNRDITPGSLEASFRQGSLFPAPHKLAGTKGLQSSKIEYVPEHAGLPTDVEGNLYLRTVWEDRPGTGKVGSQFKLEEGESEINSIYGAPVFELHFGKWWTGTGAGESNWQLFGFGLPKVARPSMISTEARDIKVIPEWVGRLSARERAGLSESQQKALSYKKINLWAMQEAEPGVIYLPMKKEEYEGVMMAFTREGQTQLEITNKRFYTKVGGVRVPIYETNLGEVIPWDKVGGEEVIGQIGGRPVGEVQRGGMIQPGQGVIISKDQQAFLSRMSSTDRKATEELFNVGNRIDKLKVSPIGEIDLAGIEMVGTSRAPGVKRALAKHNAIVYGSGADLAYMSKERYIEIFGKAPGDVDARALNYFGLARDVMQVSGGSTRSHLFGVEVSAKSPKTGEVDVLLDAHPLQNTMPENPFGWKPTNYIESGGYRHETFTDSILRSAYGSLAGREYRGTWQWGPKPHRTEKDINKFYGKVMFALEQQPEKGSEAVISIRDSMRALREHPTVSDVLGNKKFRYGSGENEFFSGVKVEKYYIGGTTKRAYINPTVSGVGTGVAGLLKSKYSTDISEARVQPVEITGYEKAVPDYNISVSKVGGTTKATPGMSMVSRDYSTKDYSKFVDGSSIGGQSSRIGGGTSIIGESSYKEGGSSRITGGSSIITGGSSVFGGSSSLKGGSSSIVGESYGGKGVSYIGGGSYGGGGSYSGAGYYGGGGSYSRGTSKGGSTTTTTTTTKTTLTRTKIPTKPISTITGTIIIPVERKVKRRKRRSVIGSQWIIKNPVPTIKDITNYNPRKYNVDPLPSNLRYTRKNYRIEYATGQRETLVLGKRVRLNV